MTVPKKPLSKTESAIQLGNILKYAGGRGGGRTKLRKIGEKATYAPKSDLLGSTKRSSKIGEVQTRPKKSLKNQKVNKSAKVKDLKTLEKKHPKAAMNKKIPAGTIAQGGNKIRNTGNKSNPESKSPAYKLRLYKKGSTWKKEHVRKKDKK